MSTIDSDTPPRGARSAEGDVWLTHSVHTVSVVTQAQHRSESFSDGGGI